MEKKTQLFVDGIANLNFTQGTFRFDLASYSNTVKADDGKTKTKLDSQMKIIMTPQGFVQTMNVMQRFLKEVEEKGIIHFGKQGENMEDINEETHRPNGQ